MSEPTSKSSKPFEVVQPFPSDAEVAQLSAGEAPALPLPALPWAPQLSWTIEAEPPASTAKDTYAGVEPNARAFAAIVTKQAQGHRPTAPMACAAAELARFLHAAPGTMPTDDVEAFMFARCGVTTPNVAWSSSKLAKKAKRSLDPKRDGKQIAKVLADLEPAEVGFGTYGDASGGVSVIAYGFDALELEPVSARAGASGHVVVRGKVTYPTEWISAASTQGEFGSARCVRTFDGVGEGAFALDCRTDPDDARSVIQVFAAPVGSLLGGEVARIVVSPDGSAPLAYSAPAYEFPTDGGSFDSASIVAAVNSLRTRARLEDVRLAAQQDAVSGNLFPFLLQAKTTELRNRVGLGLLAGYRVDGIIASAEFTTIANRFGVGFDDVIAGALFMPYARHQLLGRDFDVLSTAVAESEEADVRRILAVSYELFSPRDFSAEEASFLSALDGQRSLVGLPPVVRVQGPNDMAVLTQSAERIRKSETSPADELDTLLEHFSSATKRKFFGVIYTPMRLYGWTPQFGDELFKHEHLAVATKITYFQPDDAAWGQHVVLVVFTVLDGPL